MFRILVLLTLLSCIYSTYARGQSNAFNDKVTIDNTETFKLTSQENGRDYFIKVGLPRGYVQGGKTYPVLYVLDAETNFGGVYYIAQRLMKDRLIPEIIVVGIAYNTDYKTFYDLRAEDLRPAYDDKFLSESDPSVRENGGAQAFSRFIRTQLVPAVEDRYTVDAQNRTIYGHSYGGLYSSYALLYEPDLFSKYIILSPSLWWGERRTKHYLLVEKAKNIEVREMAARIYMGSGELEGRIDDLQTSFAEYLRPRLPADVALKAVVLDNETHRTIFGRAFTDGMRFVYGE